MQSRSACSHSYCRSGERRHGILGCMDMATALPSFQSSSQFSRPSFGLPNPSRSPSACACLCQHHQLLIYTIWLVNRWGLVQDLTLAIIMLNYTWTIYMCVTVWWALIIHSHYFILFMFIDTRLGINSTSIITNHCAYHVF